MLFKNISYIDENLDLIEDMDILVKDEKIVKIDKNIKQDSEEVYNGKNKLAVSGFYNTHCHVPMTLLRGYGEGLPLQRWLNERIFPFEAKLTPEDLYYSTLHGCMEMIKSGVCSFTDMYFYLDKMIEAVEKAGIKVNICNGILSPNPDDEPSEVSGVEETFRLYEKYNCKNGRIKIDMGLHSEYMSTSRLVKFLSEEAKKRDMIVHVHVSETKKEHEECKKRHNNLTPVKYYEKMGLLENKVNAAHCVYVEEEDIDIMSKNDFTVAHCPSSNMKLASGFAPIKSMMEKGVNVTVGTDGASSNNNLNYMEEIHLASLINKGINFDPEFLDSKDMLKIATINGAKAQGRENSGAIKEGNSADIVVFDLTNLSMRPNINPISNIIYSAGTDALVMNMVDGKVLYQDGEFKTIDKEEVLKKVDEITKRIISEM